MKKVILLGVILSMGLPSCKVMKNYESPEVNSNGLFRETVVKDTESIASIPWREYFKDPILQSFIDEGLSNNFDMRIAAMRVQQAEASLTIAKSAYFPTVALVGQGKHSRYSMGASGTNVLGYSAPNEFGLGIAVQWEADIWGKLNSQSKAKYAQLVSTQAYRNLIQTSLVSNIATTYYSLLALDEQLRVTKEMIKLLEESSVTMKAMMDAGLLNGAAVEQSRALLYNTQISVPNLEMQIRQLENALSMMLGRKSGDISRQTLHDQTVPSHLEVGVPIQMLSRRPDVMQAEMGFRYAFEMKNAAQASLYPSISLNSGSMIGFGSNTLANFFKPENILASIIGGLVQPLFAGNQLRGQLKIMKSQQEEALLTFEKTVLGAGQEVSNILYTFDSSVKKNELRTKQVKSLNTAVSFTQELLKAGEGNYIEVLNAEQSLLQAQLGQVSDKLEQLQASVNLYRALGGGLE